MSSGIPGLGSRLGHYLGLAKDIGGYYKYIPEGVQKNNIQRGQGDLLTSLTRDLEAWCQAWELHNNQHTAIQPMLPKTLDEIRNESGLLNTDLADGDNKPKTEKFTKGVEKMPENTRQFSTKDQLQELNGVLEATNNLIFHDDRKPESWRETLQRLLQENEMLKSSVATKEETIRLLQARIETLSHAMMQKTKVEKKYQEMSMELKQLKRKEDHLEKLMKGKELFLTVKIHQVRSLQSHLTEIQEENKTLKQTMKRVGESMNLQHPFGNICTQPNMDTNHVGQESEDTDLAQNVQETDFRYRNVTQEYTQVLENLVPFSSTTDFSRNLKGLLASNGRTSTDESGERSQKADPLGEPAQGLEEAMETPGTSLAANENTTSLFKKETPSMIPSKHELETHIQQMSSQMRQLKKNQAHLQKLVKGKDIYINAKNRQLCSLNKQLAEKEKENNTWKKIVRKHCPHSATENIPLETEEDQKSAELRKLKKQQHALEKVMKAKGLVVKAKTHQVHTLEDTLLKKEEENSLLKQSVRKLEEAVSTLQMDIARLRQEQEKSLERAQEEKNAFEDTNMMMPKSFPEKEVAACELREEVPSGAQLLIKKEDTCQQLLSATESMLKKSPEFTQEREEMLLATEQDHLKKWPCRVQ